MGGDVTVDTEKGKGTCFTVRFPAAAEEHPDGYEDLKKLLSSLT
jgi:hypothetical protein